MENYNSVERINSEHLIHEVEKHPAVWDPSVEEYSSKIEKRNAWSEVISQLIPDFEGKSQAEKNEIVAHVQKKWKGIRASYTRELIKRKNEKSGPAASGRKQYVYFETLRFLERVCKQTTRSMDDDGDAEINGGQEGDMVTPRETEQTAKRTKHSGKKKNNDDELIHVLRAKFLRGNEQPSDESGEDRLFLLSLVSELKKVPADKKLLLKSQIIMSIAQAQQYQYPALPVFHPTLPPHIFPHVQQQTFHGGQYPYINPIPSGSAPLQATSTPSPSPSTSSDASCVDEIIFQQ